MEYIQPQQYPGAFSDTAARVLQTVSRAGVWMPATSDLNGDQLRALLFLRNAGYIEYAAFGGYRVKGNPYTVARASEPAAVLTILARYGIVPARPVVECRGARKRPGTAPSWLVVLPSTRLPVGLADEFGALDLNGNTIVVQLKGA